MGMLPVDAEAEASPLAKRYATEERGVGGRIKVRPEDFLVDEIPLYDPSGTGEHVYLGIEKTDVAHHELIWAIRRALGVPEKAVGFAGMKDKAGVTRQMISVHMLKDVTGMEIGHPRIKVLWAQRHGNKLRRGHLRGNRFSIRIREVQAQDVVNAAKVMRRLEEVGSSNYFGPQRFGYRVNNHQIGVALLRNDHARAVELLLGTTGGRYPGYQKARREHFDAGRLEQAAEQWTIADRWERIVCNALARGKKPRAALGLAGRGALQFWSSAAQSAVFNRVVDERLAEGTLNELRVGDLAFRHGTGSVFRVTEEEFAKPELAERVKSQELAASGPLWGRGMTRAEGATDKQEAGALRTWGLEPEVFDSTQLEVAGARRPLRVPVRNAQIEGGVDEHGAYIRVAFDLPRGAYATTVLREIMKNDATEEDEEAGSEETE